MGEMKFFRHDQVDKAHSRIYFECKLLRKQLALNCAELNHFVVNFSERLSSLEALKSDERKIKARTATRRETSEAANLNSKLKLFLSRLPFSKIIYRELQKLPSK
jgi:hypothetical protein